MCALLMCRVLDEHKGQSLADGKAVRSCVKDFLPRKPAIPDWKRADNGFIDQGWNGGEQWGRFAMASMVHDGLESYSADDSAC